MFLKYVFEILACKFGIRCGWKLLFMVQIRLLLLVFSLWHIYVEMMVVMLNCI